MNDDIDGGHLQFRRNEVVVVRTEAAITLRPGELAWVISAHLVNSDMQATKLGFPRGTLLYLVEFYDGSSVYVPGDLLRRRESGDGSGGR